MKSVPGRPAVTLDDKYLQRDGTVFLSSNQALVRLPLDQARRDAAAGLVTAGYISGYRGSPLGVYDSALWAAQRLLDEHHIRFVPGLNEELAASAIRGTQQLAWFGASRYQGIFGLWYGKGIGVDRACESLKLGNLEGASATGGFLVVAGDDHGGKSSDSAHQSEHTLIAAMVPVLYPATIGEIIEFGLYGWAMSRFSGCYVGLKCITDTLDLSATIVLPDAGRPLALPSGLQLPPEGLNLRQNLPPLVEEQRLVEYRLPAATAFARSNGIDRVVIDGPLRQLSIVSAGKAYLDVRQALLDLGLDESACRRLGIRLYKPGLVWPMDPQALTEFAAGSRAVLVVEEKRPVMEDQIARALYALPTAQRPALAGKQDLHGATLLPSIGELNPGRVRHAIRTLLAQLGIPDDAIEQRHAHFAALEARTPTLGSPVARPAYFCSGCPHNTSTRVPEGSLAMGGIGCHGLVAVVMDRNTLQFVPMGHEGSPWVGVGGFVDTPHVFQNMGDGTYSHSGVLAIRAAVASGVNITYKLLYNDAVAMTGGQPVEQDITPLGMVQQLISEGVRSVRVVSDHPEQFAGVRMPPQASVHHRDELDTVQRELREHAGVTAIVYVQTCATELRRRRKRALAEDPDTRVYINPEVCEGCGDCSDQSNCISVQPLETPFGRKRRIDQSTCNKDLSCIKGFCPSFVTLRGARVAIRAGADAGHLAALLETLPPPPLAPLGAAGWNIVVGGIGGTGVLTVGALLGMAAHLDGLACSVLDMTGMAQKGGAVTSHIRIGGAPDAIHSSRLGEGMSDVLLACDLVVGASAAVLKTVQPGITRAVLNTDVAPTGDFQRDRHLDLGEARLRATILQALDGGAAFDVHASQLSTTLTGDSIGTNLLMLGYALQKGLLPLSVAAIEQAIRLNGSFVAGNLRTLALGRLAAHDPAALARDAGASPGMREPEALEAVLASRMERLTAWQDARYAGQYRDFVERVRDGVAARLPRDAPRFAREVALTLARLMSYKDEYEVARLYADPAFMQGLRAQFDGDFHLEFHLAPPVLPGRDASGRPRKRRFGPWVLPLFRLLARARGVRGSVLDPFGHFPERRMERALIADYRALVEDVAQRLEARNLETGIALVQAAADIAGFGPVKAAAIERYRKRVAALMDAFVAPVEDAVSLRIQAG